jgi:molybdopterin adenylyltransferase
VRAAVLTVSDSTARGDRTDESGPCIASALATAGFEVAATRVVPDDPASITATLVEWADELGVDVILTTGGTGFSLRDSTPEATLAAAHRRAPGIAEALRGDGMRKTPRACLTRGEAVLRGTTLIVNLPGSLRAVTEGMEFLLPLLPHAVTMIAGGGH